MIIKNAGSLLVPGAGPLRYVSGWHYPLNSGATASSSTMTTVDTRGYYIPFYVFESREFNLATVYNSGAGDSGDDVNLSVYSHNINYGPRTLKLDLGEITFGASAAASETAAFELYLTRGWWWLFLQCNGAADMYSMVNDVGTGQAEIGVPSVVTGVINNAACFPYVDTAYAAAPATATAPTAVTSSVPKVWLKAA